MMRVSTPMCDSVTMKKLSRLIDFAGDRDAGAAENMGDLGFAQAGGVILKGELILLFIDAETAQAIGVSEFAEAAELIEAQGRLQFVGDFEECHGGKYKVKGCKRKRVQGREGLRRIDRAGYSGVLTNRSA